MSVPVLFWIRPPVPLMALLIVTVSERLKIKSPLFVTLPVPSDPVVPPLPTFTTQLQDMMVSP